jgi:hypothetical protein
VGEVRRRRWRKEERMEEKGRKMLGEREQSGAREG